MRRARGARRGGWLSALSVLLAGGLVVGFGGCVKGGPNCAPEDDGDPCTVDACSNGVQSHGYLGDGHPCVEGKLSGACLAGQCRIECTTNAQCDDGRPCTTGQCKGGLCAIVENDLLAPPSDGSPCTTDYCNGGEALYVQKLPGTPCGEGGASECLAGGVCEKCKVAGDCGEDTECRKWTCEAGACVVKNLPKGTVVVAGDIQDDCRRTVCTGSGGTMVEPDPTDAPKTHPTCNTWTCEGWTPVLNPQFGYPCPLPNGTPGKCDQAGVCVQCLVNTDCPQWGQRCDEGVCITCGDTAQNGQEICGGVCPACKGAACSEDAACASGHCAATNADPPRVCCNDACLATCFQCSLLGACVPVSAGKQDPNTCDHPGGVCNGNGQCKIQSGYFCKTSLDCLSGACDLVTNKCK